MQKAQALANYVNIESKNVEGWLYPRDMVLLYLLDMIQKNLNVRGHICEIGVYKGKSLILLGMFARENEKIYAFDSYPDDCLEKTRENIERFCPWPLDISYVTGDTSCYTTDQLKDTFAGRIRLLHIDAGHEYHEVLHTLYLISPFVADDGIIVMDDYHDREFPGVAAAVLDFCLQSVPRQFVPFLVGGNKIYLCTPGNSTRYQKSLLEQSNMLDKMRLSRIRDHLVLVSSSKLPMRTNVINQLIDADIRDFSHQVDIDTLARIAKLNAQNSLHAATASSKD